MCKCVDYVYVRTQCRLCFGLECGLTDVRLNTLEWFGCCLFTDVYGISWIATDSDQLCYYDWRLLPWLTGWWTDWLKAVTFG